MAYYRSLTNNSNKQQKPAAKKNSGSSSSSSSSSNSSTPFNGQDMNTSVRGISVTTAGSPVRSNSRNCCQWLDLTSLIQRHQPWVATASKIPSMASDGFFPLSSAFSSLSSAFFHSLRSILLLSSTSMRSKTEVPEAASVAGCPGGATGCGVGAASLPLVL